MSFPARDPGPAARFEDLKNDAQWPSEIFRLLTADEPKTLREIAICFGVPKGRFMEWFTTQHSELYEAALKVRAADMALEALAISDEQGEVVKDNGETFDPDVGRDKLRIDTRLKLAAKFDRARYGETVRVDRTVTFAADAGLVGTMGALLTLISSQAPAERLIAPEQVPEEIGADTAISVTPPARAVVDSGML